MPTNRKSTRPQNPRPGPIHVQHIADTAATRALDAFANSPERKAELEEIMQRAINNTLDRLGINATSPEALQQFRADMVHLRTWREFTELVKRDGIGAATSWFVKGFMAVVALGLFALLGKHLSGN